MIEIIANPNTKQWAEFVYDHPHGNIFQTPEMAEVYKHTKNYETITLAAIDSQSDHMLALLNAVLIKEFSGFLGKFTARSIIQGGPLFIDNETGREAVEILMEHYDAIACKEALYSEMRNMWDASYSLSFKKYRYEDHLNFLVDLSKDRNELWQSLSKSRRYGIKKSYNEGVYIEQAKARNEISVLYNLLRETYRNAGIPLADKSLFESMFEILSKKNMGQIFFAKFNNVHIGVIVVLNYRNLIYNWYAGASKDHLTLYPNDILPWHVIEWGSINGFSIFDFGGAGQPNEKYGVRDFKKQFGGEMVNFGRFKKIHSSTRFFLAEIGFEIYKKIPKLNNVNFS